MDGLIYAYQLPKSVAQQRYMQERRAALAEARRRLNNSGAAQQQQGDDGGGLQADLLNDDGSSATGLSLERTFSGSELNSTGTGKTQHRDAAARFISSRTNTQHRRTNSADGGSSGAGGGGGGGPGHWEMESSLHPASAAYPRTSSSASSSQSEQAHHSLLSNPFELKHGRRYLRELPYPLPVDLHEIQRQNLRTLLCCRVFGRAVCSPSLEKDVPRRVLEIGCGSGYWSTICHDYFSSLGHGCVMFTGLDVAPLAPDLKKQGMDWTFVQHDIRRIPYPFDDDRFDLVMLKDMSLVLPLGLADRLIEESIRILRPGGTLEVWESDHVLRSLNSRPPIPSRAGPEQKAAMQSATFLISVGTPFAPAQNKYLSQANSWIQDALDRRKLPPVPCSRIAGILHQEAESLNSFGARRVAIPLGELRWERDNPKHSRHPSTAQDSVLMPSSSSASKDKGKAKVATPSGAPPQAGALTPDQAALRQVALLTVMQMIENLEPLLKETSGKNSEEWSHWWGNMLADVMDPSKTGLAGECLEIGAWWGVKKEEDEDEDEDEDE